MKHVGSQLIFEPLYLHPGFQRLLLADAKVKTERSCGEREHALVEALADLTTFSWALECVLSRAFQLPPDNAVAPVLEEDGDIPIQAPALKPPEPEDTRMALLPLIDSMNHYGRIPTHMYWEDDGAISLTGKGDESGVNRQRVTASAANLSLVKKALSLSFFPVSVKYLAPVCTGHSR